MRKVLTGVLLTVDIVLLILIINAFSQRKGGDELVSNEDYGTAGAYSDIDEDLDSAGDRKSGGTKTEASGNSTETDLEMESQEDADDAAAGFLDTEGIEGIVDIEDSQSLEEMPAPSLSDFMWYYDGAYYNGIPEEATFLSDKEVLGGYWKGFFWYGHEASGSYIAMEFANVLIQPDGNKVDVDVKMNTLYIPQSEPVDESDDPVHKFRGTWDENGIYATGAGNINITAFYEMPDGRQYCIGTFDSPDGTPTVIALVR